MLFNGLAKDNDVVEVHETCSPMQASQDVLHEPLEGCWRIAQPIRHHSKLVKPTWCHKSRLLLLIDIPLPAVTIRMYDECGVCFQTLDKETPSDDHSEQEVLAAAEQMDENNESQLPCNHEEIHRMANTSTSFVRALPAVVDCSLEVPSRYTGCVTTCS